jgi:hypothetical protein
LLKNTVPWANAATVEPSRSMVTNVLRIVAIVFRVQCRRRSVRTFERNVRPELQADRRHFDYARLPGVCKPDFKAPPCAQDALRRAATQRLDANPPLAPMICPKSLLMNICTVSALKRPRARRAAHPHLLAPARRFKHALASVESDGTAFGSGSDPAADRSRRGPLSGAPVASRARRTPRAQFTPPGHIKCVLASPSACRQGDFRETRPCPEVGAINLEQFRIC